MPSGQPENSFVLMPQERTYRCGCGITWAPSVNGERAVRLTEPGFESIAPDGAGWFHCGDRRFRWLALGDKIEA